MIYPKTNDHEIGSLPPHYTGLNKPITTKNLALIDTIIYNIFQNIYLKKNINLIENVDFRNA